MALPKRQNPTHNQRPEPEPRRDRPGGTDTNRDINKDINKVGQRAARQNRRTNQRLEGSAGIVKGALPVPPVVGEVPSVPTIAPAKATDPFANLPASLRPIAWVLRLFWLLGGGLLLAVWHLGVFTVQQTVRVSRLIQMRHRAAIYAMSLYLEGGSGRLKFGAINKASGSFQSHTQNSFRVAPKQVAVATVPAVVPTGGVPGAATATKTRLLSLDAFRGLTILAMLLVNNVTLSDATPSSLTHAGWIDDGGIHIADLVFPWFLFIVGLALPYSWAGHQTRGGSTVGWLKKVTQRAAMLFLLGVLVDSAVARQVTVMLDVLQLIGLAYWLAALFMGLRPLHRFYLALGLLVLHSAVLTYVPVPGVGAGHLSATENIVAYLNDQYLTPLGLRGLISVVPTGALVLIGTALGEMLRREQYWPTRKLFLLATVGAVLMGIGQMWRLGLPFNKPIWTASYILFTAGVGAILLALFYAVVDIGRKRNLAIPLIIVGVNPIVLYVGSILVKVGVLETWHWRQPDGSNPILATALQQRLFEVAGRIGGGWLYTVLYIAVWWVVLFYLYRKKIFLRV